ncbi:HET-domain-containing protein [Biscogniauxia marginata]|nr:HET-domain-containing protein [Biscogniauxia marginata]
MVEGRELKMLINTAKGFKTLLPHLWTMLCEECLAIFEVPMTFVTSLELKQHEAERWSSERSSVISPSQLKTQAAGCHSCQRLWHKINAKYEDHTIDNNDRMQVTYALDVDHFGDRVTISLTFKDQYMWVMLELCRETVEYEVPEYPSSTNTASEETMQFIRNCLNECQGSHSLCSKSIPAGHWYPTRLIEILPSGARLIETAETDVIGPYISLSHCWGKANILTLRQSNMGALKKGIEGSSLPDNFRHAIQVCRRLGVNYIWIDSLCILQDSAPDWQRESATMLQVYRHALCTLAATKAPDPYAGLFTDRNPANIGSGTLEIDNGRLRGRFRAVDHEYFGTEVGDAPLNRRSWVVQERLLSPRVVHFAAEQVFWDCASHTLCETMPWRVEVWPTRTMLDGSTDIGCKQGSPLLLRASAEDENVRVEQALGQWASIVGTYSECGLTFLRDKLIAISGVAEHLGRVIETSYYAGLWRDRIEIQMAWVVNRVHQEGKDGSRRPMRNDIAPTWSWASVTGGITIPQVARYSGKDIRFLASVTEIHLTTEPRGEDAGEGGGGERYVGYLRLRGILNSVIAKQLGNGRQSRSFTLELTDTGLGSLVTSIASWDVLPQELEGNSEDAALYFLPLFEVQHASNAVGTSRRSAEIRGLLLRAIHERGPGLFTRCGHATLSARVRDDTGVFDKAFEEVADPRGKEMLPCEEYDSDLGHLMKIF